MSKYVKYLGINWIKNVLNTLYKLQNITESQERWFESAEKRTMLINWKTAYCEDMWESTAWRLRERDGYQNCHLKARNNMRDYLLDPLYFQYKIFYSLIRKMWMHNSKKGKVMNNQTTREEREKPISTWKNARCC